MKTEQRQQSGLSMGLWSPWQGSGSCTEMERPREAGRLRAVGLVQGLTHTSNLQEIPEFLLSLLLKTNNSLLVLIH